MRDIIIKRAFFKVGKNGKPKISGFVRELLASDPRSLDHPCHKNQIRELAREIARGIAREQYAKDRAAQQNAGAQTK